MLIGSILDRSQKSLGSAYVQQVLASDDQGQVVCQTAKKETADMSRKALGEKHKILVCHSPSLSDRSLLSDRRVPAQLSPPSNIALTSAPHLTMAEQGYDGDHIDQLFAAKKDFIREAYQGDGGRGKTLRGIKTMLEQHYDFPLLP